MIYVSGSGETLTLFYSQLDVTSSDKENKAFWSTTSSSDTSSRSSPQTDITGQPVEPHTSVALHPANREVTGGDIVLIPVTEEGAPIAVVGRQKMSSPEQDAGKASPPESSGHGKAFGPGEKQTSKVFVKLEAFEITVKEV